MGIASLSVKERISLRSAKNYRIIHREKLLTHTDPQTNKQKSAGCQLTERVYMQGHVKDATFVEHQTDVLVYTSRHERAKDTERMTATIYQHEIIN